MTFCMFSEWTCPDCGRQTKDAAANKWQYRQTKYHKDCVRANEAKQESESCGKQGVKRDHEDDDSDFEVDLEEQPKKRIRKPSSDNFESDVGEDADDEDFDWEPEHSGGRDPGSDPELETIYDPRTLLVSDPGF